jgi:hypothetical protein
VHIEDAENGVPFRVVDMGLQTFDTGSAEGADAIEDDAASEGGREPGVDALEDRPPYDGHIDVHEGASTEDDDEDDADAETAEGGA